MRFQISLGFLLLSIVLAYPHSESGSTKRASLQTRQATSGVPKAAQGGSGGGMPPMPTDPETCAKILKKQQEMRGTGAAPGSAPKTRRSEAEILRRTPQAGGNAKPSAAADPDACKKLADAIKAAKEKSGSGAGGGAPAGTLKTRQATAAPPKAAVSGSGTGMPPMPTDPETCAKVLKKQQEARGTAPAAGSAPKTKRSDAELTRRTPQAGASGDVKPDSSSVDPDACKKLADAIKAAKAKA